jgi:hypothetical protein
MSGTGLVALVALNIPLPTDDRPDMARSRLLQEERREAPRFLRAVGWALTCWGLMVTGSILAGALVTFHELASPFTAPDIVAFLGQLVVGVALLRSKRWGYRLGWFLAVYLSAFGAVLLVATTPEFSEPRSSIRFNDLLVGVRSPGRVARSGPGGTRQQAMAREGACFARCAGELRDRSLRDCRLPVDSRASCSIGRRSLPVLACGSVSVPVVSDIATVAASNCSSAATFPRSTARAP